MSGQPSQALILVPGLLCDGAVWEHQIKALSQRYAIKVPDLTQFDRLEAMAAHILDIAPESFSIVGHSMGGRVALEVWRQAPDRVARLALLDTGVDPASADEPAKRQVMLDISAGQGMTALADAWLPPMVEAGRLERDEALRATLYAMVERMSPAIHRAQIEALLYRPDAVPLLSQISCPVLVAAGENDLWSPPAQHRRIAEAIPGAEFTIFPEIGHMSPVEGPEVVTAALERWMQRG
jgi:pimeloyl-ACP methyl ester carboxylesterase